ncbi:hypothetical protein GLOIN_2v654938 [Rhizophagus clarus]|uniref:Uncharacterized protein n=1 Tax=Rhizophagus clarus TaxID=94130 RepID=A0A8H3LG13_9GLOM|nr:hypothetical protein GLOIN_2v654938 [Rhizophagus clarus]
MPWSGPKGPTMTHIKSTKTLISVNRRYYKNLPRTSERNIALGDEKEKKSSLYDTFPVHIHNRPEPSPFIVGNKNDHDIKEKDDESNADLTIVGGKSIDWIIGTLDESIVAQMRKEIKRAEVVINDNMDQEIKLFLKSIVHRDIKKTKENLNQNAEKFGSFEKEFVLHFVKHMA